MSHTPLHILGIGGTFMAGIALLAKELGFTVSGTDNPIYPPMSQVLQAAGIGWQEGYTAEHLPPANTPVVVGNALSRGNACIEAMLEQNYDYLSGPAWLAAHVLKGRHVIAISGTHGKTTTSSLVAWILEAAGLNPGFLIGGVPVNFGVSARYGLSPYFVVEADEYDTAFFDKRSKFLHYHPNTLVINNLEFDHADIFENLAAIQKQFHHLVRTVPGNGLIITPTQTQAIEDTLAMGCWTPRETIGVGGRWQAKKLRDDGSVFEVSDNTQTLGTVEWSLRGDHNIANALAALACAHPIGVPMKTALKALTTFKGVKRRLELLTETNGISVYDDFAHHPTAIQTTLQGLRAGMTHGGRLLVLFEPRSNSMRLGTHQAALKEVLLLADKAFVWSSPHLQWDLQHITEPQKIAVFNDIDHMLDITLALAAPKDVIVIMSNGSFGGIHEKIKRRLAENAHA